MIGHFSIPFHENTFYQCQVLPSLDITILLGSNWWEKDFQLSANWCRHSVWGRRNFNASGAFWPFQKRKASLACRGRVLFAYVTILEAFLHDGLSRLSTEWPTNVGDMFEWWWNQVVVSAGSEQSSSTCSVRIPFQSILSKLTFRNGTNKLKNIYRILPITSHEDRDLVY